MPVSTKIQMRRDTAANWTSVNPILASGEWGLETDTNLVKTGDGVTAWSSLSYQFGPLLDETIATDPTGAYFDGTGLVMSGVASNWATAPNSAALQITGDIDLRAYATLDDWTPATTNSFIVKRQNATTQYAYQFNVTSDGKLNLNWSTDGGTTVLTASSTVATGVTDGTSKWVRVTLDVDNGAAGRDIKFYLSDDGTTWTQLGTTVTQAGTTSIFAGTSLLNLGSSDTGGSANILKGKFLRAQILNGIGGTTVFDANFETVPADSFAFTESSSNAATVTLTTTRYSFGLPGTTMTGTSTFSITANRTYYNLIKIIGKPITVKQLAFEVTSAPLSTVTTRLAVYAAGANMQPTGAALIETSAITIGTTGTGAYRIRITPTVLKPGNYVLATNATPTGYIVRSYGQQSYVPNTLGANLRTVFYASETLSGGFPNPGTKWSVTSTNSTANFSLALLGWS